ncbi:MULTISPECIES: hypothetical protein [unclassified Mesorhizobium]|uniref:hypothetical protein n=1 Tax=unclassified Mesorhizobium TaxID=325217 RepID=UPI000BAE746E|nr:MULTISPECIES: hypothetical protein [unclassified Mesorhizobium]PBC21281.1 hypothetical protein CK226_20835 [Mesorhizobium sp. WSM4311]TRD04791.1 hypothetical protein FJV82_13110 [Mesorhizobium sp. WSM4305]
MEEKDIADFMLKASKFEFFLVNRDTSLAHTNAVGGLIVISGVNWTRVAQRVEANFPFHSFDFASSGFEIFAQAAPQYLVIKHDGRLGWDCDDEPIASWDWLLSRSYAQLRNNAAHGNKHQMPAPFTYDRTARFLPAGIALMNFIANRVFSEIDWDTPIFS